MAHQASQGIDFGGVVEASMDSMIPYAPPSGEVQAADAGTSPSHFSDSTDFEKDKMAYPLVRLGQPMTPEVVDKTAAVGDWILTGFEPTRDLRCVPLLWGTSRAYTEGQGDNLTILCRSLDAAVGELNPLWNSKEFAKREPRPSGECTTCPCSLWTPDPRRPEKNKPPLCTEALSYICCFPEFGYILAEVRFKKTGMNAANIINSLAKGMGFGNFMIVLGSKMAQSSASPAPYAVPTIKALMLPREPELRTDYENDLAQARAKIGIAA